MRKSRWTKRRKRFAAALVVALTGFVWGLMLLHLNLGQGLRRASYDLPFHFSERNAPAEIAMVYLDDESHKQLDQPLSEAWDRRIHAALVDRLRDEGAALIIFDILFHDPKEEEDAVFADSIARHGKVILAGEILRAAKQGDPESLLLAAPELRRAAAGWGLAEPVIDGDGTIRRIRHGIPTEAQGTKPSLSWIVHRFARGGMDAAEPPEAAALLDFYGRSDSFTWHQYAAVLENRNIPVDAFRGKIVFVGSRQQAGFSGAGKDMFPTPYSKWEKSLTSGVEIHATAAANLLEGLRLDEVPDRMNQFLIFLCSIAMAALACLLPVPRGVPLCLLLGIGVAFIGGFLHRSHGTVMLWTIPALGQMPLIAGLSLGAHYLIEYSARWKLRRAFRSYMSDEQARQIDEDEVSLELGGKEVEVTVLFSDLAGFTTMSEGLPPQALSKALIRYFESATAGIMDNQGTIIKYIGDAVLATWGAPLRVDRECDRAIDAAIQMQLAGETPVSLETAAGTIEQVLETRVGIHHGLVLAGNLGSSRRFDYTVVGDSVNTAARLEGLNKMLGTSILVSEAVLANCSDRDCFLSRRMGSYVLKGKTRGIDVYEILGRCDGAGHLVRSRSAEYLESYRLGLEAFITGDWAAAGRHLNLSLGMHDRDAEDPASRLMLDAIRELVSPPTDWRGELFLLSK